MLIWRRFQNERPRITEPPSKDGEEVRPNTNFIKLNARTLMEMLEAFGIRPRPGVKKLQKQAGVCVCAKKQIIRALYVKIIQIMKHVIEHFDAPNGSLFTAPMCSTGQVEQLYEEMSFAPRNANQACMDAWTLKPLRLQHSEAEGCSQKRSAATC